MKSTYTVQTMNVRGEWVTRHEYKSRSDYGAWAVFHMYRQRSSGSVPTRILLDGKPYYKRG